MPTFLLSNDDGAESPFLPRLARALSVLGRVRIAVPASEQSWQSKAMTRYGRVTVRPLAELGPDAFAVAGTPSDSVNLGIFELFDGPPDWVISGINIGSNTGSSFIVNSGTVGAALEGALVGVPAAAFSTLVPLELFRLWTGERRFDGTDAEAILASTVARTCDLIASLIRRGLPPGAMMVNVNYPGAVSAETPVRWVPLQETHYGSLFKRDGEGFVHRFDGRLSLVPGSPSPSDREVVQAGEISATALNLRGLSVPVPPGYAD